MLVPGNTLQLKHDIPLHLEKLNFDGQSESSMMYARIELKNKL